VKGIVAAIVAGAVVGLVSRWIDTSTWAPDWIGYVFTPWLAAAWLAGAVSPSRGALLGLTVLFSTVVAYVAAIVVGGTPVHSPLVPGLVLLAVLAGAIFGAAGATWRGRGRGAAWGGALLGVAVVIEGLALQLAVSSTPEHLLLAGESLVGIGLIFWLVRTGRPLGWPPGY
jgi:hypothetical protein